MLKEYFALHAINIFILSWACVRISIQHNWQLMIYSCISISQYISLCSTQYIQLLICSSGFNTSSFNIRVKSFDSFQNTKLNTCCCYWLVDERRNWGRTPQLFIELFLVIPCNFYFFFYVCCALSSGLFFFALELYVFVFVCYIYSSSRSPWYPMRVKLGACLCVCVFVCTLVRAENQFQTKI